MKIKNKLIIAFIIPILLIGIVSLIAFIWNRFLFIESADISANKVRTALLMKVYNNELSRYNLMYLKYYNPADRKGFENNYILFQQTLDNYNRLALPENQRKYFNELLLMANRSLVIEKELLNLADEKIKLVKESRDLNANQTRPLLATWQNALIQDDAKKILLYKIESDVNKLASIVRYFLIDSTDQTVPPEIAKTITQLNQDLATLNKSNFSQQETGWVTLLTGYIKALIKNANQLIALEIKTNALINEDDMVSDKVNEQLETKLGPAVVSELQTIQTTLTNRNYAIIVIISFLIIAGLIMSLIFTNYLIRPITYLKEIIGKLRAGDEVQIKRLTDDEIGELTDTFSHLVKENTEHSLALNEQNWLKEHIAEMLKIAQAANNIEKMTNTILTKIATLLNAGWGAFYIMNEEEQFLKLYGSYGYVKRKHISNHFKIGESLVGQAALEGKPIILTDVPDDYIHITSGLGEKAPNNIIVLPLMIENRVLGVIEIASFKQMTAMQIQFLEQLSMNIAVVIEALQNRLQTEISLKKVQETSAELQTQQEELRATNEELEEKTHTLQQSEEELKTQSEELQSTNEEMEEKIRAIEKQKIEIETKNAELERVRQQLEEKASALTSAGKYKTEFMSNMSHELRTPLNSMLLLSKSFASNADGNLTPEQIEQANIIYNGGKDLLQLINDILDLSKVEAGKLNIQMEEASITEILDDLKRQFDPTIKEKGLDFIIENNVTSPTIYTDAYRLKQIIRNLISNAIKFTSKGYIKIEVTQANQDIKLHHAASSDTIIFNVIDTGIGIEKSKFHDIFEAFQQAYGNTDRTYGGTGLGLTISRELAELLGGHILLESTVGKGSQFSLVLPLKYHANTEKKAPAELKKPRTNESISDDRDRIKPEDKSILIVHSEEEVVKSLAEVAQKNGYKCITTDNYSSGIHLATKFKPDGIILFLNKNETENMKILDRFKAEETIKHIPIHVISTRDSTTVPHQFKSINFIKSPINLEQANTLFEHFDKYKVNQYAKILLIEDEVITQNAILALLKNKKFDVISVKTGKEALDKLKALAFDGMILDLKLPDMEGRELLKTAKEQLGSLPPIVIYSMKDLSLEEYTELNQYTNKIVRKEGDISLNRLLNECSLFLYSVKKNNPHTATEIKMLPDSDTLLQNKEILVVDDDMRNVYALSLLLKRQGMNVTVATNGEEALKKIEQMKKIDIVIMDIMMPIMDGYETMRHIRKNQKYKVLPIIAITAKAMPDDKKSCIDAGANDYITKPIDEDKLLAVLRIWLSSTERSL